MGKVYLYYSLYDVTGESGSAFLEEPALYAFTQNKDFAKKFEVTRYMPAFVKVVKKKKDFPNYNDFLSTNRDAQMIEFPIPCTEEDKTTIIGTYQEDRMLGEHCELLQYDIDDFVASLRSLREEKFITKQAYEDLCILLNYETVNGAADFDIFHMFYSLFRRTLLPPKIWMVLDEKERVIPYK